MKITAENIKKIGFIKHGLFNKHSGIYQLYLKDSFEVRVLFETKKVKSNDEAFDCKLQINGHWINHKTIETDKCRVILFAGDEFDKSYKLLLKAKTIGSLNKFINEFNCA